MDHNEKNNGWLLPKRQLRSLPAGLYLIGTPIGNLSDITLRALDSLAGVDILYCEDTRVSGKLLKAYDIKTPMKPYHDHSNEKDRHTILKRIENGERVGLISDAGLPLIADPGYKLVTTCQEAGHMVTSIPGPSSTLTALQLSGLPSEGFTFAGFLPSAKKARQDIIHSWAQSTYSLIFFETATRLGKALADFQAIMPSRKIVVARELTKLYEEIRSGNAPELLEHYNQKGLPKGEIVLLVAPADAEQMSEQDIHDMLKKLIADHPVKEAAKIVAVQSGRRVSDLYDIALKIKNA